MKLHNVADRLAPFYIQKKRCKLSSLAGNESMKLHSVADRLAPFYIKKNDATILYLYLYLVVIRDAILEFTSNSNYRTVMMKQPCCGSSMFDKFSSLSQHKSTSQVAKVGLSQSSGCLLKFPYLFCMSLLSLSLFLL